MSLKVTGPQNATVDIGMPSTSKGTSTGKDKSFELEMWRFT